MQKKIFSTLFGILAVLLLAPKAIAVNATGHLDRMDDQHIGGWAYDPDDWSKSINVKFYRDGVLKYTKTANGYRPDVPYGPYHGFGIYPISTGVINLSKNQKIEVKAVDMNTGQAYNLVKSPRYFIGTLSYTNGFTSSTSQTITWQKIPGTHPYNLYVQSGTMNSSGSCYGWQSWWTNLGYTYGSSKTHSMTPGKCYRYLLQVNENCGFGPGSCLATSKLAPSIVTRVLKPCSGTAPTGSYLIKGPSYAYSTRSWAYSSSATTSTQCKWKCNTGYHQSGNNCVKDCTNICGSNVSVPANATGISTTCSTSATGTCNNSSRITGWTCNSGYHKSGNSCAKNTYNCLGTAPSGGNMIKGLSTYTTGYTPVSWTYSTSATSSTPCKWECLPGYHAVGTSCEADSFACSGTAPTGDDLVQGPATRSYGYTPTSWTYTTSATSSTPCQWKCDSGYTQSGNTCVEDTSAPILISSPQTFEVDNNKVVTLNFQDLADDDLSGLKNVSIEVPNHTGALIPYNKTFSGGSWPATSGPTSGSLQFTHNFSSAGYYKLTYTVCDLAGNCKTETINNFFDVQASCGNSTLEGSEQCDDGNTVSGDGCSTTCMREIGSITDGTITISTGSRVADGRDYHLITLDLKDSFGQPVVSETGITEVRLNYEFTNTTELNQVATDRPASDDSAYYVAGTSSWYGFTSSLDQRKGNQAPSTGWLTSAAGGDGSYRLQVRSYAPTSAGYEPIVNDGFNLQLLRVNYEIENLATSQVVTGSLTPPAHYFAFSPTVEATPLAMKYDPSNHLADNNGYVADSSAADEVIINLAKRFLAELTNKSTLRSVNGVPEIQVGLLLSSSESDIVWLKGVVEKIGTTYNLDLPLSLDTDSVDGFSSIWNPISNLTSMGATNSENFRFKATPELLKGGDTEKADTEGVFDLYLDYVIDDPSLPGGQEVIHKSGSLIGADNKLNIYNPSLQIIGSVFSSSGTYSNTEYGGDESLGNFTYAEAKAAINRNIVSILQYDGCQATDITITGASGDEFTTDYPTESCVYNDGQVLFVRGKNVIFDTTSLPNVPRTVVVYGGNIYIKNNLIYTDKNSSLGIIALKDTSNNGGNIVVFPNVTNINALAHIEGSLISVNQYTTTSTSEQDLGKEYEGNNCPTDGSEGFCDRTSELNTQLYWKGIIASKNTIGGSDKNIVSSWTEGCPDIYSSWCDTREEARRFDLRYFRTFNEGSDSSHAAIGVPGGSSNKNAFIIEYDSRIHSNKVPPLFYTIDTSKSSEEIGG